MSAYTRLLGLTTVPLYGTGGTLPRSNSGGIYTRGAGSTSGSGYTSGGDQQPDPVQEDPRAAILSEIEKEWRAWWKEHYGSDYVEGSGPYGRAFLAHLDPLNTVQDPAVLTEVLAVLKDRHKVEQEAGPGNFVTFGSLFFAKVGNGTPVQAARQEAITEIQADPVLFTGYTSGTITTPGTGTQPTTKGAQQARVRLLWLAIPAVLILTRKNKRK